jgi:hypothetical protein
MLQFGRSIDEVGLVDNLAEDEWVFRICHYAYQRNAIRRNQQ